MGLFETIKNEYIGWRDFFINFINRKHLCFFAKREIGRNVPFSTRFGHYGYGVVINHSAVIGENCFIGQNVTIGSNSNGVPVIGSNVKIFCNACVIGGVNIGDFCVVGAGAVVTKDVPGYSLVVGFNRVFENKYKKNDRGF